MLPTIAGTLGFLLAPQDATAGRLICYYLTGEFVMLWIGSCNNVLIEFLFHPSSRILSSLFRPWAKHHHEQYSRANKEAAD